MEIEEKNCPDCGTPLQPKVFSVSSPPVDESNPDYESAFLAKAFLYCCQCSYAEPMITSTIKP